MLCFSTNKKTGILLLFKSPVYKISLTCCLMHRQLHTQGLVPSDFSVNIFSMNLSYDMIVQIPFQVGMSKVDFRKMLKSSLTGVCKDYNIFSLSYEFAELV